MNGWLNTYLNIVLELNRLLSMRFVWNGHDYKSAGLKTPIGESVVLIGVYHNKSDYDNRDVEIAKLRMLVQDLQRIEKYSHDLLLQFKKQIYREVRNNWERYFGWRMEIHVAASLIKRNVKFIKKESPDFTIVDKNVFIECGSRHVTPHSSLNIQNKLHSVIAKKSMKTYCNLATALFLDTTNIYFNYKNDAVLSGEDAMKTSVKHILENTGSQFGSVLLFSYFMTVDRVFHSGYLRIDNNTIDEALSAFLDTHYPIHGFWTGPGWTPRHG